MANNVSVANSLRVSNNGGGPSLSRSFNYTPAANAFFNAVQVVGTVTESLAIQDCAGLSYLCLYNPDTNTATVTVTMASVILKPGDVFTARPGTSSVTLQATANNTQVTTLGVDN